MSYVLSPIRDWLIQKLTGEKLCPAPCDKDKVPAFGVRESKGQVTTAEGDQRGNLNFSRRGRRQHVIKNPNFSVR